MVGWHLLLLLTVELLAYGAIGRHAYLEWAWSLPAAVSLGLGIYLGVRAVLVGAEFVLARWKGDPIPDSLRISGAQLIAMYLRELAGWIVMFSLILPWIPRRRSVVDRRVVDSKGGYPVVLVHGLACNRGNWIWFRRQLERRGYRAFVVDYTPWYAAIARYPPQLASAIEEVLAATGSDKVIVIGHSMGGLVARAYLAEYGHAKVAHVITLGTPHQGTWMTRFGFTANIRDMATNSPWLARLRERETQGSADPYLAFTCVFTYHDNLVTPQHNATLPGAARIAVSGIGHLSLALSPEVLGRVEAVIGSVTRTSGSAA